jgi:hypothetical protein
MAKVMLSEYFVVKVDVRIHYHGTFLFQLAPLTTSVCVTETIKMNVPLIIIPFMYFYLCPACGVCMCV